MNKRRLLKLAELLEADAENKKGIKFYFFEWGRVTNHSNPVSCGTQACALGLAAISGAFKHAGLSYRLKSGDSRIDFTWNGRGIDYAAAASKTFDISKRAADFLFTNGFDLPAIAGASAERAVAKRIRDFVAGRYPTVE
jgi:hypothetical protein